MTFEQYMTELRKAVEEFEIYWRESNAESPEEFPLEMAEGDWDEQFHFFGQGG